MIISKTPLRISFTGGGTDFKKFYSEHEGCVVSTTIDKYVYVILKRRFDDKIVVNYTHHETVQKVESIKHDYVRAALDLFKIDGGIEITTIADISGIGSGLGSSSSLIVGLVNACQAYKEKNLTKVDMFQIASRLEIVDLKQPIGIQDHCSAVWGGINKFVFNKNMVEVKSIYLTKKLMNEVNAHLILLNIGNKEKTADIVLKEQEKNIENNISSLNALTQLAKIASPLLCNGDMQKFAVCVDKGWEIKKSLSKNISNDYIDEMITKAKKAGALAGKVCGSGLGGHLLVIAEPKYREKIIKKVDCPELPVCISQSGSEIIYNG